MKKTIPTLVGGAILLGNVSVLAVNIEYAYTHIAGIAVATSSNCMVARRGTNLVLSDNTIIPLKASNWFDREEK